MRPLLGSILAAVVFVAGCKGKMFLTVSQMQSGDSVLVTVRTPSNTTVVVAGEARKSHGIEFFTVPSSKLIEEGGRTVIHVEATRDGELRQEVLRVDKPGSAPVAGARWGVALLGGSGGSDLKVSSPFGSASVGGDPIVLAFSAVPGTKLVIGGSEVAIADGKAAHAIPLDQLVSTAPLGAVFPTNFMAPKIALLVEITTPDHQRHTEELTLEASKPFGPVAQRILDPARNGTPVDLGPSPSGGYILLNPTVAGFHPRTGGRAATLKDLTIGVWQTNLPDKSAGNCSYLSPSRGRISVASSYSSLELAAYDLRKGKLRKKQVLRGSGSRCPTVITSFGGYASAAHTVSQAQIDAALTKLLK